MPRPRVAPRALDPPRRPGAGRTGKSRVCCGETLLETVASSTMEHPDGKPQPEVARMSGRFEGRVVVVTGGARGIGDAIVRRMVAEGARAVVPDLADPADPVPGARYLRCDITDRAAVEEAHASIEAT